MSLSGALFVVCSMWCAVNIGNDIAFAAFFWGVAAFLFACAALTNDEKKEYKIDRLEKKLDSKGKDGKDDG